MKRRWKMILITLILLPIVVFFPACSCGNKEDNNSTQSDIPYTVHFYTGTEDTFNISNQTVNRGGLIRRPEDPTRTGYVFIGWYTSNTFEVLWRFDVDTVEGDMTLYAKWDERKYG